MVKVEAIAIMQRLAGKERLKLMLLTRPELDCCLCRSICSLLSIYLTHMPIWTI